jgi:hypothetical protein
MMPPSIDEARVVHTGSGAEETLSVRADSHCHFFQRFASDKYEVGLRLDWSDLDTNGNPRLDADFFIPGETKPIRPNPFPKSHHTTRTTGSSGMPVYEWTLDQIALRFYVRLLRHGDVPGGFAIA